jgi:YVTN family beta-propeller protein
MRYLRVRSVTGPMRPWFAAGALLALAGVSGCGNQYRPVVTPITPTGPASQPQSYAVAFSQPNLTIPPTGAPSPCPNTPNTPGVSSIAGIATLVDFSGETVLAQANITGVGPSTFALDGTGSTAYSTNCDGTISTVPLSTTLQSKNVLTTTLPSTVNSQGQEVNTLPTNLLVTSTADYVTEPHSTTLNGQPAVGVLTSSPPSLKLEIPITAPSLINVTGVVNGQRIYSISQGNSTPTGQGVTWGQCDTPSSVTTNGEADGIEVTTNTVSSELPVGVCPVYGLMTADGRRTFILNRGSGTITVIDSSKNQLDTNSPSTVMQNATIPVGAGPVHADLYAPAALLVTANYDSDTISIINVSINGAVQGFTDTANFGQVLATVPVGHHPAAVTVLQDGSRVYVANEGDGTVTIVNLSSFTVEGTLAVNGHPRSIASTFNAPLGKVYTIAQDSPYLTVIRTDTDIVSASILLQGNGVDVRTTTQFAGASAGTNNITQSRSVGSGAP